jgi:hypothetical protein
MKNKKEKTLKKKNHSQTTNTSCKLRLAGCRGFEGCPGYKGK